MTLTRNNISEWYYKDGGEDCRHILQKMDDTYSQAITLNQAFWSEADIDTRFKAGDQTLYNDVYGNLPAFRNKQFYFNRIRRVTNMISGHQRKHRKSIIAIPVENGDDATASLYTKAMMWSMNRANAQDCISRTFDAGAITAGIGLVNLWLDYSNDIVSGDICCDYVSYSSFLIDPYFKKQDLSDCNFVWRRQWFSKTALKMLLPGRDEEIDKMNPQGNRDGKFQFQAEAYNYAMRNLLAYDEYWYKDLREQTMLVDLETGESTQWNSTGKEKDEQLKIFLRLNPQIKKRTSVVPTTRLCIVVEGKVMYDGKNPLDIDRYPFIPVIGYHEPEIPYFPWRVQGVVRNLRDSQFLYNRRKIIELEILESQVNSGFKYKVDSLVNPKDIYLQGQGKGIAIKKTAEMSDVEKIMPGDIPPSMIQLSQLLGEEISQISGVNEELLGSAQDDKTGILAKLRQGAGLTTLEILFDQLDASVKQIGSIWLELIQKHFTPGKIKRITNEDPTPQFYDKEFGRYDVEIEQGLNTTTQRQLHFAQLFDLRQAGLPISGADLLEASTLQDKDKLMKNVAKAEEQQMQMQQMQSQAQMQLLQAQQKNLEAKSLADQGLGIERISRVQENRALAIERIAESKKDQQLGVYHMAKAMKELEDLDMSHIERLVKLVDFIKSRAMTTEQESNQVQAQNQEASIAEPTQGQSQNLMAESLPM